jgi:6-phosphofructokinase 1
VAVIAEGLLERIPPEEMKGIEGARIRRDDYGHLRLAEMDLAFILKSLVERRFVERGASIGIVHKTVGYEVRSASPLAFDCEYVRSLGYGAVEFLLKPGLEAAKLDGALVCQESGKLHYLDFNTLIDPETGKTRIRRVDITTPSYRIAREYMIRLEREDFEDKEKLRALARAASTKKKTLSPEEFRNRFHYLITELPGAT